MKKFLSILLLFPCFSKAQLTLEGSGSSIGERMRLSGTGTVITYEPTTQPGMIVCAAQHEDGICSWNIPKQDTVPNLILKSIYGSTQGKIFFGKTGSFEDSSDRWYPVNTSTGILTTALRADTTIKK